jgi:hypothetical protein
MITSGIIVLCIASILRAWGLLNLKRGSGAVPIVATGLTGGLILMITSTVSIILGLLGAILIGSETSLFVGLILFVAFWFLSRILIPLLEWIGL